MIYKCLCIGYLISIRNVKVKSYYFCIRFTQVYENILQIIFISALKQSPECKLFLWALLASVNELLYILTYIYNLILR
jgi:hypothetical protein